MDAQVNPAETELQSYFVENLEVRIYSDKQRAGSAGAALAAAEIRKTIARDGEASVVFASAVSQDPFLTALRSQTDLDWTRVTAFHLDEYAGMSGDHPASFRRFLRERVMDHFPIRTFHQLNGEAPDLNAECSRYAALLEDAQPGLVILGIGENGHLAFIDPQVCNFTDPQKARPVALDEICRMQQVHDGQFQRLEDVPDVALSLTIPFFLKVPRALVFVNGKNKSAAVRATLQDAISEACPASALRRHQNATLFLDPAAASDLRT
ncbi:MAG: glucosamine-6-phosphate deaminase [Bryobacteraceae bacterium]